MATSIAIIENNIIATNTIRQKLSRSLIEKGFKVTILTSGLPHEIELAKINGFSVINIGNSSQNPLDIVRYMLNLHKALKQIKADVCLTFTIRPAIWGNIVTRVLKIPTITNITGIGPLFSRNNVAYRGARILYKFVLKKSARIFFQNYDDMNIFLEKKFAKPETVFRVPGSGVDYTAYSPLPKARSSNHMQFLFISRLVKDKGIVEYVMAAEIVKKQFPEVECAILGPLWQQNLKDNTVTKSEVDEWQNKGFINYLGETTNVKPFIANSDCIVLPSYREGTSNVLLEASSMARPCITTNTTGCKEIVDDDITGYICEVKNENDLANKMIKMLQLSAEQRSQMGYMARQKVIKQYDKKIVVNAYLKAIAEVLKK